LINLDKAKLIIHACLSARKNHSFRGGQFGAAVTGYLMRFFHYDFYFKSNQNSSIQMWIGGVPGIRF